VWPGFWLIATVAASIACAVGAYRMWGENWIGFGLLGWLALWFFIFALFCFMLVRARLRPTAWLARLQTDGLLLNFRSHLNWHFPPEHKVIAHIPFNDIEWIREHKVQRTIDEETQRKRYLELKVDTPVAEQLEKYLSEERQRRSSRFSRDYPVQVIDGNVIRIEWGAHPRLREFLHAVQPYIALQEKAQTAIDFKSLQTLDRVEQERRLIELIEAGDRINAIQAARLLYKFNLTEANRFIDELSNRTK